MRNKDVLPNMEDIKRGTYREKFKKIVARRFLKIGTKLRVVIFVNIEIRSNCHSREIGNPRPIINHLQISVIYFNYLYIIVLDNIIKQNFLGKFSWLWIPNRVGDDRRDNIFRLIFTPMESEFCLLLYFGDAQRSSNYNLKISHCIKFPFDYQGFELKIGLTYFMKKSFLSYVCKVGIKYVRNRRSDCKHASGLSAIKFKNKGGKQ